MKRYFLVLAFLFILPFAAKAEIIRTFYVDPFYHDKNELQIEAVLKYTGEHAYFYIEYDWWQAQTWAEQTKAAGSLKSLAEDFDDTIYPKEREVFGSEWSPGIDQDKRIIILFTDLIEEAGGYFNPQDEYPEDEYLFSNQREMFYLNIAHISDSRLPAFIAHEFQHLISHNQKLRLKGINEEIWLNEARSEYAPTLCGYNTPYTDSTLETRVQAFLDDPSNSLTEWQGTQADYGPAALFIHYLVEHYSQDLIKYMMESQKIGIASIEEVLEKVGSPDSFSDVFTYWTIANLVNDCSIKPKNRFCYLTPGLNFENLHVTFGPPTVSAESITSTLTTKDWGANYHQLTMESGATPKDLKVEFQFLTEDLFRVPYILYIGEEPEVHYMNFEQGLGKFIVPSFGEDISKVTIIPSSQTKTTGFDGWEFSRQYEFSAQLIKFEIKPSGTLLRAKDSSKVYITEGNYKRWIQTAEIFNSYEHLKWEDIEEISQEELNIYEESSLVRAAGGKQVYEINGDGTSHWLRMSAEQFLLSGRLPEMIFEINQGELDLYKEGADVIV